MKLKLADCSPREPALLEGRVKYWLGVIHLGKPIGNVEFAPLKSGKFLITDGNHRCRAAVEAGVDEIKGHARTARSYKPEEFAIRHGFGRQAFMNLKIVITEEEQTQAIVAEEEEMRATHMVHSFREKLLKRKGRELK